MRLALLVTGPNASGKTTMVTQAIAPYRSDLRLRAVFADNWNRSDFKGTQKDMEALLLSYWDAEQQVLVVEGTNRVAMAFARVAQQSSSRSWEAHIVRVTPQFLRDAIEARCRLLRKRFRDDYWTDKVLTYESSRRFATINDLHMCGAATWWPVTAGYVGTEALGSHIAGRLTEVLGPPVDDRPREALF